MTAKAYVAASWSFATYGTSTLTFTDSAGTFSVPFAAGYYEHVALVSTAGVAVPAVLVFATALAAAMNAASPTVVHTVTFTEGVYVIAVTTGTIALTFGTAAQLLMGKLLGFTATTSAAASATSTKFPWFWLTPAKPGPVNYVPPTRIGDAAKEALSDAGTVYVLMPTSVPRVTSFEFHYEPKERVDRDYLSGSGVTSTHLYTWEDLWDDYGLAQMPIGVYFENVAGIVERLALSLSDHTYSRDVMQRMRAFDDVRFKIILRARLWVAA